MATADVNLCNQALARLGKKSTISDITEDSNEANYCNLFFDTLRKLVLEKDQFGFATKYRTPSDLGSPPEDVFLYQYAWPSDALEIVALNPAQTTRPEFEVAYIDSQKSILTQEEITLLKYTVDVNVAEWPGLSVEYLTLFMALKLAMPLTKNFGMYNTILNETYQARIAALASSANQRRKVEDETPVWISGR